MLDPFLRVSNVRVSQPWRRKEVTRDNFDSLLVKLMVLHPQILFSLAIAEPILMLTSAEPVPSLHRVALRYLKLVTSFNFWPFVLISAPMLFVLLIMIFFFLVLTSIHMLLLRLRVCWRRLEVHHCCCTQDRCRRHIVGSVICLGLHQ